ncbi:MAG: putative glycoside hydrolase [Clostridia bacterium]|nr:putative glycoside hydrolase [Clostridia bacterium]
MKKNRSSKKSPHVSTSRAATGFFEEYPDKVVNLEGYRINADSETKRKRVLKAAAAVVAVVMVFCVSFTVTRSLKDIVNAPVEEETGEEARDSGAYAPAAELRACFIGMEEICASPVSAAKKAVELGANAVMTDLKTPDGRLYYRSNASAAASSNAWGDAPRNAADAARLLRESGVSPVARISCLRDSLGSAYISGGAILAFGGGVYTDAEGFGWLDPYSYKVRSYIAVLVREIAAMGFEKIILSDFRLPAAEGIASGNTDSFSDLNEVLRSFLTELRTAAGSSELILELELKDVAGGENTVYGTGNMFSTACSAVAVDLRLSRQSKNFTLGGKVFEDPASVPFSFLADATEVLSRVRLETGEKLIVMTGDDDGLNERLFSLMGDSFSGVIVIPESR